MDAERQEADGSLILFQIPQLGSNTSRQGHLGRMRNEVQKTGTTSKPESTKGQKQLESRMLISAFTPLKKLNK